MPKRKILSASILFAFFSFGILFPKVEHTSASEAGQVLGAFSYSVPIGTVAAPEPPAPKVVQSSNTSAPALTAKAVLVLDRESGSVLYSKNAEEKLPIASLTKLMTALIAAEDPSFDKPITIKIADQLAVSPSLGLRSGDVVQPEDLVKAMLVGSANDAALALSNHFGSDQKDFIARMNAKAAALEMSATNFSTPIGFDVAGNYSDADDLSKLVGYALQKLPFEETWSAQSYSFVSAGGKKFSIRNSNRLVGKNAEIKSIKTGKTQAAMENMIVIAENKEGRQIISILVGSQDRSGETVKLVDYIFQNYTWE